MVKVKVKDVVCTVSKDIKRQETIDKPTKAKTSQDKPRQAKTSQAKPSQDKTRQDKPSSKDARPDQTHARRKAREEGLEGKPPSPRAMKTESEIRILSKELGGRMSSPKSGNGVDSL